jgi:hypothetical protein
MRMMLPFLTSESPSNSNAAIRQEFRKIRFPMIDDTAPSAMNWREVSIYVVTSEGVYIYDAGDNTLDPVFAGDFRGATGTQSFVKDAAVNLVYVSDLSKTSRAASSDVEMFTAADVGFISEKRLSLLRFPRACHGGAGQYR